MSKQFKHIKEALIEKGYAIKGQEGESNDCTVRALSITKGINYKDAMKYAYDNFDRKPHKGPTLNTLEKAFKKDKSFNEVNQINTYYMNQGIEVKRKMTVQTFVKTYNKGKYFIIVRSHALAVVDGVIIDYKEGLRRPIQKAWRALEDQRAQ